MKRSNILYIVSTIIVLVIFILNLLLINGSSISLVKLNSLIDTGNIIDYDYDKLLEYIDMKYRIPDIITENGVIDRSYDYENKLISFARDTTEKLFDVNYSSSDFMNKYYIRKPINVFGLSDSFYYNTSYNQYLDNYQYLINLKKSLMDKKSSYSSISDIKVYYGYTSYYVVQLYLDGVDNSYNKIIEYKIVYEKSSDKFKISDALYFDEKYLDDYKNIDSNIKRFNVLGSNSDKKVITDEKALEIKNKYLSSVVKIDVYDEKQKNIDTVTGFFISSDTIITTFDIFSNGIFRKCNYDIQAMDGKKLTFNGIITFSRNYNIAIIKIDEKYGNAITLDYSNNGVRGDDIMTLSIDGNIYIGTLLDTSYEGGYMLRSSLPLDSHDRGSILVGYDGNIIGINTWIGEYSDVLLSPQIIVIMSPYSSVMENIDSISAFKLNLNGLGIR